MKKDLKRIILVLTSILAVGTVNGFLKNENLSVNNSTSVSAESIQDYLKYEIVDEEVIITGVNGQPTSIEIPSEIEGYPVTSIGDGAFDWCRSLTSITIPNSVTSIGSSVFVWCSSLTSITIPNSVTSIGAHAFSDCENLKTVEIPNSVISLGKDLFENCYKLINIKVDENNTEYCDVDGVLFDKNRTVLYRFPAGKLTTNYTIPNTIKNIGNNAFDSCDNLQSIEIPNSVTSIGEYAFSDCENLKMVEISNSVISLGEGLFENCYKLINIKVDENNTEYCDVDGVLFDKNRTVLYKFPEGKLIDSYKIPDSVISIGYESFRECWRLKTIEIPNSVTNIRDRAFWDCGGLRTIEIPNSVTSIGRQAFANCRSLPSIEIPNSITSISDGTFSGCYNLTSIVIPNSVTSISDVAFGYAVNWSQRNFRICGYVNSEAQKYAKEHEMKFADITKKISFSLGKAFGKENETVRIPINIANNGEGISGLTLELVYDHNVFELVDCYSEDLSGSWTISKKSGYMVFLTDTAGNENGDGIVGFAEFRIKEMIPGGEYLISIGYAKYSQQTEDKNQESFFPQNLISGSLTVQSTLSENTTTIVYDDGTTTQPLTTTPAITTVIDVATEIPIESNCDIDGNGKVTALDLVKIKKQILGYETEYSQTADVNKDGKVDAKDLVAMVKYLLEN